MSRISAESRCQEGVFLGIFGGGVGASGDGIGTPDGVQPARAIKMVPEIDAWDIELLLVKELPWDGRRADLAARIRLPAPEVDEGGRPDVAMELAARHPVRPVQYGGSCSSWEVRPEPSRRRDAEEQFGGDLVRARLQDPQGVVRTAEEVRLQSP